MRHLAGTCDGPAICMVQGVADFAFHNAAPVVQVDQFQAIRTTMLFLVGQQQFGLGMTGALPLRFSRLDNDRLVRGLDRQV